MSTPHENPCDYCSILQNDACARYGPQCQAPQDYQDRSTTKRHNRQDAISDTFGIAVVLTVAVLGYQYFTGHISIGKGASAHEPNAPTAIVLPLEEPLPYLAPPEYNSLESISPIFTREVQFWGDRIAEWARQHNVDPNLAATVMQIESCGDPLALSRSGAMGLFQVMPFHFDDDEDPYYPDTNALRGLGYLAQSLQAAQDNPRLALAGYNGGIGVIGQPESTWSDQVHTYVTYGYPIYQDAVSGITNSQAVTNWLNARGLSLCTSASRRLGLQ